MSRGEPLDRLSAILGTEIVASVGALTAGRPLGIGWATVELDRALAELGAALRIPAIRFAVAPASAILGARCLAATGVLAGGVSLVLLEPTAEGRLAAALVRHDEGPAAVWLAVENLPDAVTRIGALGHAVSPAQPGPFGAERLVDGSRYGPHLLLVEGPGTIRA